MIKPNIDHVLAAAELCQREATTHYDPKDMHYRADMLRTYARLIPLVTEEQWRKVVAVCTCDSYASYGTCGHVVEPL